MTTILTQGVTGSPDILINNRPAARAHVDMTICSKHSGTPPIATGSATVMFNNMPAARVDDTITCGAVIVEGSPDVIIEGGTVQTDTVNPENLVPAWVHWSLLSVGIGAAVVLGGPIVAALGLVGGIGGGMGCGWLGGRIFGEGSDGQKWVMLGGSVVGGMAGAKGGMLASNKTIPVAKTPLAGFTKEGIFGYRRGLAYDFYKSQGMPDSIIDNHIRGIDLRKTVSIETLPAGTKVTQYQSPGNPQGVYYSDPGTNPSRFGISPETQTPTGVLPRQEQQYITNRSVKVLKSTAKDIEDDWSIPGVTIKTEGGDTQYYTNDKGAFTPYP